MKNKAYCDTVSLQKYFLYISGMAEIHMGKILLVEQLFFDCSAPCSSCKCLKIRRLTKVHELETRAKLGGRTATSPSKSLY